MPTLSLCGLGLAWEISRQVKVNLPQLLWLQSKSTPRTPWCKMIFTLICLSPVLWVRTLGRAYPGVCFYSARSGPSAEFVRLWGWGVAGGGQSHLQVHSLPGLAVEAGSWAVHQTSVWPLHRLCTWASLGFLAECWLGSGVSTWRLHALNHEWHFQCALSVEAVTSFPAHGGGTRLLSLNKESAEVTLQGG